MAENPFRKDIKFVTAKGKRYAYFKTGEFVNGKQIMRALPDPSSPEFGTKFAAYLAIKTKRTNRERIYTLAELVRAYQTSDTFKRRSRSTQDTYAIYLNRMLAEFTDPQRGSWPVVKITRPDIRELLEQQGYGAQKMQLAVMRTLFRYGRENDKLPTNFDPTKDMRIDHAAVEHEPWPEALIEQALETELRLPVALLYYTGQRIGAVVRMRWQDIQDGEIYVPPHKRTSELYVPVHSKLAAILAEYPKGLTTILCQANGKPLSAEALRQRIKKWSGDYVPHGLRKNAVGTLLEAGCTISEVKAITGQSLRMIEHYSRKHNQRKSAKRAMGKWEAN
jgi:integrase